MKHVPTLEQDSGMKK